MARRATLRSMVAVRRCGVEAAMRTAARMHLNAAYAGTANVLCAIWLARPIARHGGALWVTAASVCVCVAEIGGGARGGRAVWEARRKRGRVGARGRAVARDDGATTRGGGNGVRRRVQSRRTLHVVLGRAHMHTRAPSTRNRLARPQHMRPLARALHTSRTMSDRRAPRPQHARTPRRHRTACACPPTHAALLARGTHIAPPQPADVTPARNPPPSTYITKRAPSRPRREIDRVVDTDTTRVPTPDERAPMCKLALRLAYTLP